MKIRILNTKPDKLLSSFQGRIFDIDSESDAHNKYWFRVQDIKEINSFGNSLLNGALWFVSKENAELIKTS